VNLSPPAAASFTLTTTIGNHAYARTVVLRLRSLGAKATHEHDGRLLLRTHLITAQADEPVLRHAQRALSAYWRARMRGTGAAEMRKARRARQRRLMESLAGDKAAA
jgi:hypothetical protein